MATKFKISKRAVDDLDPRATPYIAFDDAIKGFGVKVKPSGAKAFVLEYRPGAGGRGVNKKRLTLGQHGAMTCDQARTAALAALARIRLGEDPQADKARERDAMTVAGLVAAFLEGHVANLKPQSRLSYASALAKLTAAHGATKAEALTRTQVAQLHRRLGSTPFTANRTLSAISSMYAWAENHGLVAEGRPNPARKVTRYREEPREQFLSADELGRLGDALDETRENPFLVAAVRLYILTGARLREILDAKWSQVDFGRGMLRLADSKTGPKPIYLSAAAMTVLASLPRHAGNPYIIPGRKESGPWRDPHKAWNRIARAAGLDGLRIHDLRHSFASVGAGRSLGLPIIGKLLGHSQPSTTARYAHLAADPLRRAADMIGTEIDAAMNRKAGADITSLKGDLKR